VDPIELSLDGFGEWAQVSALVFDEKDTLWVLVKGTNGGFAGLWGLGTEQALVYLATGEPPAAPALALTLEGVEAPEAIVKGPDDHLWIADFATDTVVAVADPAAEGGERTMRPEIALIAGWDDDTGSHSLLGPTGVAFDDAGRPWVNYWTNPALARFDTPADGGATRVPSRVIDGSVLDLPAALVTDHGGSAWYGNEPMDGAGEIVALSIETGMERARARSVEAESPTTLLIDPR
jgi:hypothetical protein